MQEYLNQCSKCGGCQAACPLYRETQREPLVARGKLFLMKSHLEGNLELSPKMMELMSLCLLCKACTAQCPNSIPVDKLVLAARQEIADEQGISFLKKNIFQHLLQNNGRLTWAAKFAYLYQKSGLQWLVRKTNVLNLLPGGLGDKEKLIPKMNRIPFSKQVPKILPVKGKPQLRVGYYTGCLTNYVFEDTGHAMIEVLNKNSMEVVIPEQWCCGLPALASGDQESALALACKNIDAFKEADVDYIVTDCASCASMLREYGELIQGEAAKTFSEKVVSFSQLLGEKAKFRAGEQEVKSIVTYHDPCHLCRGLGVVEAPRKLIRAVPGITFREMNESDCCCGAAGSFNITHNELANKVGERKAQNVMDTEAQTVITECPSCIMQLQNQLERQESPIRVMHIAELLNKTY